MAGLCKAVLIGHLGRDPETRNTPDGLAVTSFSVAATEKVKGQDKTEWFRIVTFGKLINCTELLLYWEPPNLSCIQPNSFLE